MRLLLIEDDEDLGQGIKRGLESAGYVVGWETDGMEGFYRARDWDWDVIILDRLLPQRDGLSVLKTIRKTKSTPVLMLTALNSVDQRLEGIDEGADDYLGKPFDFSELLARVKALIRRAYPIEHGKLVAGPLRLLPHEGLAYLENRELKLSTAEFRTLEFLLLRQGKVVSRQQLEDVLGEDDGDILPNTIDVHIHRLRTKIGPGIIQTQRGNGYYISKP